MSAATRFSALTAMILLVACQPSLVTVPAPVTDPDVKAVLGFFSAYGNRDLEGMMKHLDEAVLFRAPGSTLNKQQLRDYFQGTLQKYPQLRVEAEAPTRVQDMLQVRVKVETNAISVNTWIIDMKHGKILSYSFAPSPR